MRDDYQFRNKSNRTETAKLRDPEKPNDDANEQIGDACDRQSIRTDFLHQPRQGAPIDRGWRSGSFWQSGGTPTGEIKRIVGLSGNLSRNRAEPSERIHGAWRRRGVIGSMLAI
jgi:hypothetical protein